MNDTSTSTRRHRAAAWIRAHRPVAIAIATGVAVLVAGGAVAATDAISHQRAVDDWTGTRTALASTAKSANGWATRYGRARQQAVDTAAAAKELVDARDGTLSPKLWESFEAARATTERAVREETPAKQMPAPKLEGTSRAAYETATRLGKKRLTANTTRVQELRTHTSALQDARAAILTAGGKLAAATRADEAVQTAKTSDATDDTKGAVHDAVGVAVRAHEQHPDQDVVLTSTRDYLTAVTALRKSNADEADRKAQEAAAAAAAAASARAGTGPSTTLRSTGRGSTGSGSGSGTGSGSRPSSGGRGSGSSAPAAGGGTAASGGSAPAPAPAPGPAPGGSSGGGSTARPPQYALQHSTRVSSCNPGEHTLSFGPNVNSMPSRYLSVSVSWNGSAWVYSGTTCGS